MAAKDEMKDHKGEAPEAPDQVEGGEETGMKALTEDDALSEAVQLLDNGIGGCNTCARCWRSV